MRGHSVLVISVVYSLDSISMVHERHACFGCFELPFIFR